MYDEVNFLRLEIDSSVKKITSTTASNIEKVRKYTDRKLGAFENENELSLEKVKEMLSSYSIQN